MPHTAVYAGSFDPPTSEPDYNRGRAVFLEKLKSPLAIFHTTMFAPREPNTGVNIARELARLRAP